ncbi:nitrogen permease regulator of amino acid transport activity 3-domain-containing protein [Phanerochaete sordida]|uniref:Nitrogen permease regulator 3 n=1 Tax=Phanerochaete sordida TaxID=48140 RepID=A0A9P3GMN1_9APHY|nr:nitrogen permease regulator of amino acid transport activity 3-domain-containing protein [Phanerochaete sordida]
MSETLLAVLLVTSSAKGSSLVYRWPPHPLTQPRLARPLPRHDTTCIHADNPWRAAHASQPSNPCDAYVPEEDDYRWHRPNTDRSRALSFSHGRSHPASRRASPSKDMKDSLVIEGTHELHIPEEHDELLGYSSEFLASILCPHSAMCHQKFELVVDELAFIGHPVCAEHDGAWRFRPEKSKSASRGRGSRKGPAQSPHAEDDGTTPDTTVKDLPTSSGTWLQTFHLVMVLDLPDPSSSASGNIAKYFDTIYEQIVFAMTAVMYQEQVLHNFVETECDKLGALKDDYIKQGKAFSTYLDDALKASSIAAAMKTLYESIKDGCIAQLTIHEFPLELQLPPHLDALLHNEDPLENDYADREGDDEDEYGAAAWGPEMSFAWRLPALAPWKSLLRLDDEAEPELYLKLRGPQLSTEDREVAEQLLKFLDMASVTLNLADMASLLDWDLESQVFPTVRWLVHHRRAKIVDVVHPGLKTVFTTPQKLPAPLADLSAEFSRAFSHPSIPPLPKLLSQISTNSNNHFYGAVVGNRDMVPAYHDVVLWLLKRDLLVPLHLRVRIVATSALKEKVRVKRELARARRQHIRRRSLSEHAARRAPPPPDAAPRTRDRSAGSAHAGSDAPDSSPVDYWMSMSPKSARRQARQMSPPPARAHRRDRSLSMLYGRADAGATVPKVAGAEEEDVSLFDDDLLEVASLGTDDGGAQPWDHARPSMIADPARASALERQWLAAMSEGKDPHLARRFEHINQYFDGKCSADEILYKADISRRHLREVLHHYDEHLQTFLHPA